MSEVPEGIIQVRPIKIAEFHAVRWIGDFDDPAVIWLATRFGWKLERSTRKRAALSIRGRNLKRYDVRSGDWIIALGTNGSVAIMSDQVFHRTYREVEALEVESR